jgi:gliding motility-associated-like protein
VRWYSDAQRHNLIIEASSFTSPALAADITFYVEALSNKGCATTGSMSVAVTAPPSVVAMGDRRICYGETVILTASQTDGTISWNTPQTTVRPAVTTQYIVCAQRPPCPDVRDTVVITVGDSLYLLPATLPPYRRHTNYSQPLNSNASPPVYSLVAGELPPGIYFNTATGYFEGVPLPGNSNREYIVRIGVTDQYGCTVEKEYILKEDFVIPEIFSPNDDGINDYFMKGHKVIIMDRLGQKIFEGGDGWDGTYRGKPVSGDTYYYILYYVGEDKQEQRKTGFITIVR